MVGALRVQSHPSGQAGPCPGGIDRWRALAGPVAVEDVVEADSVGELALKGFSRPVPAVNVIALRNAAGVAVS